MNLSVKFTLYTDFMMTVVYAQFMLFKLQHDLYDNIGNIPTVQGCRREKGRPGACPHKALIAVGETGEKQKKKGIASCSQCSEESKGAEIEAGREGAR